ncbi:MAG: hypothetical protein K0R48_149 [Gammaproteobacteria bacterium]|jgi:hypothetical protein|nr:hypothetical protein [Gammaproteobacteria bacterium]
MIIFTQMNLVTMIKEMVFLIISFVWSGMILGISFFEAWVKFKTPSLTKEVGLDVGRTVFRSFHFVQWVLLGALTVIFLNRPIIIQGIMLLSIFFLFSIQVFWTFPKLCSDVDSIRFGNPARHSSQHLLYGVIEVLKLAVLLIGAIYLLFKFTDHVF